MIGLTQMAIRKRTTRNRSSLREPHCLLSQSAQAEKTLESIMVGSNQEHSLSAVKERG